MNEKPKATEKFSGNEHKKLVSGFMLDSARCQENRSYYLRFIDFAAARGIDTLLWHFTDDQGCSLQLDSVPGIASPNAYSKDEMRALVRYARELGIDVIPELASLGHCRYLTRLPAYSHLNEGEEHYTGMCPVSDDTRGVIRALINETADIFDSANFHVGMDEVSIGNHPLTRAALQTQTVGDLLADYINFLHDLVAEKGKRMWMWGDALLKHSELLSRVPKNVVICNWQYTPDVGSSTTQILLDAGYDVMLCSALISHDQPLYPGEAWAMPNIRILDKQLSLVGRGRVLGHLNTIWTPVRYIADSLWLAIDLASNIIKHTLEIPLHAQIRKFGQSFYGLNKISADHFVEVASVLILQSPLRKEWLAAIKLEPLSTSLQELITISAASWSQAENLLIRIEPDVKQHKTEYAAFTLVIKILFHIYDAARQVTDPNVSQDALESLIKRGETLFELLDEDWNRARYANDSRKHTAPIPIFQDDHLVAQFLKGLTALKFRLAVKVNTGVVTKGASKVAEVAIAV